MYRPHGNPHSGVRSAAALPGHIADNSQPSGAGIDMMSCRRDSRRAKWRCGGHPQRRSTVRAIVASFKFRQYGFRGRALTQVSAALRRYRTEKHDAALTMFAADFRKHRRASPVPTTNIIEIDPNYRIEQKECTQTHDDKETTRANYKSELISASRNSNELIHVTSKKGTAATLHANGCTPGTRAVAVPDNGALRCSAMDIREPPLPSFVLRGSTDVVTCVCFGNRNTLVSGTACGSITVWDLVTNHLVQRISDAHGASVLWLCNVDGGKLLSQGRDGKALIWSFVEGKLERRAGSALECGSLSYCRGSLASCSGMQYVALPLSDAFKVVCLDTLKEMVLGQQEKYGMCMALSLVAAAAPSSCESPLLVISGAEDGSVTVWDALACRKLCSSKLHSEPVMCLKYDGVRARGFSGSADDVLVAWTIRDGGTTLERLSEVKLTNPGLNDIAVRETDGRIVATAGWDARIRVFAAKSLKPLAVLAFHRDSVKCLAFGDQGDLASGSNDKLICLWRIYQSKTVIR